MDKARIIEANLERTANINHPYNPITGEGSTSISRTKVCIDGFPLKEISLPSSMLQERDICALIEQGANRYLRSSGIESPEERDILRL